MPKTTKASTANRGSHRLLKKAIIAIGSLLFVPVIEVALVRYIDPSTTAPIILTKMRSGSSPHYQWKKIEEIRVIFLKHCLVAEDQRFFRHHGFDWRELAIAGKRAALTDKPSRGASTITMQCARSLFLWQGRSWVRKGLEAYYTLLMELFLSKKRILELYANVIEVGDGVYGVEAGARHHFRVPAEQLTREQSAMLVALLPFPKAAIRGIQVPHYSRDKP
jgi:monofunctional biosynthetic peptidoglycan transglycosylase